MELLGKVRRMFYRDKLSRSEISRRTGLSRNTIKKWLDEDSKGRSAKNYTYDDNEGECL